MAQDFLEAAVGVLEGFRDTYVPFKQFQLQQEYGLKRKRQESDIELQNALRLQEQKLPFQMSSNMAQEKYKSDLDFERQSKLIPLRAEADVQKFMAQIPLKTQAAEQLAETKLEAKKQAEFPKASGSYDKTIQGYNEMIGLVRKIRKDPSLKYATGLTSFSGAIPGTGTKRVAADVDTLKAKTLLNVLSGLKELSSTGASGFGALSTFEGEALRNSIVNLDRSVGTKDFEKNLDALVESLETSKGNIEKTFNSNYGKYLGQGAKHSLPVSTGGGGTSFKSADDILNYYLKGK